MEARAEVHEGQVAQLLEGLARTGSWRPPWPMRFVGQSWHPTDLRLLASTEKCAKWLCRWSSRTTQPPSGDLKTFG